MNDISAFFMTVGEPTFAAAMASVRAQTVQPAEFLVIENSTPIAKAFALGAHRVANPFFLQCDADMILTPDCIEVLRGGMDGDIAVTIGFLQDEIMGDIQGVKMFRREALLPYISESVASDSDMIARMIQSGWKIKFCRRTAPAFDLPDYVLGYHRPDYLDEEYVFSKFFRQGAKARYRQSPLEFQSILDSLKSSTHPKATLALLSFCHGFFSPCKEDYFGREQTAEDFKAYRQFREMGHDELLIFSPKRIPDLTYSTFPS
jgi:hypothetical protein